jgi:hypothetical protein
MVQVVALAPFRPDLRLSGQLPVLRCRDFFGVESFHPQVVAFIEGVCPEFNPLIDSVHGVLVVALEPLGQKDQPRLPPRDFDLRAQRLLRSEFEVAAMVHEPVQVKEALIYDVVVRPALVFDDYGGPVLIQPQGVDAAPVLRSRRELRLNEADTEEGFQVLLSYVLNVLLPVPPDACRDLLRLSV